MIEVVLTYPTPEGTEEIEITGDRFTFGRGSDVDFRFADQGLSRINSTIYREGGHVWIVDENSTNGTFVNGFEVEPAGTPLENGDEIKIGNNTVLHVRIGSAQPASESSFASSETPKTATVSTATATSDQTGNYFLPIVLTFVAILVIGFSALFIGINAVSNNGSTETAEVEDFDTPEEFGEEDENENSTDETVEDNSDSTSTDGNSGTSSDSNVEQIEFISDEPEGTKTSQIAVPTGKKYQSMTEEEKRRYVEVKTLKVARMIGNRTTKSIPSAAVTSIKKHLDAYARRANTGRSSNCRKFGDDLEVTYRRASKNAPFIIKNFLSEGMDPQIGLYLAMIESEHCVCKQSPTGPLGMFQFAYDAAVENGLKARKGASPSSPDERCEPEPSSRAAAKYMRKLSGRFGTGPLSIPLAVASYNSGQGRLSNNLEAALKAGGDQQRSFWTLVANAEKLHKQFKEENIKYVPKFFAAAIIGENPRDFGLNLQPLSTYNKAS